MTATMTFDIDTTDFDDLRDRMTRLYDEVLMADAELYRMLEPVELSSDLVSASEIPVLKSVPTDDPEVIFLETVQVERAA